MGLLVASLAPVLILLCYVYVRDRYDREPFLMLFLSVLAGVAITLPVFFIEKGLVAVGPAREKTGDALYHAFVVAAMTEEVFKFVALYLLIWRSRHFNEAVDGIVYGVFVSLGFAGVENILYVMDGGYQTALVRAITAVPAHALFGVTMGYYFGIARKYRELTRSFLPRGLLVPILLHGIYDFILMVEVDWLLLFFAGYLLYLYAVGLKRLKTLSDTSVFKPSESEE